MLRPINHLHPPRHPIRIQLSETNIRLPDDPAQCFCSTKDEHSGQPKHNVCIFQITQKQWNIIPLDYFSHKPDEISSHVLCLRRNKIFHYRILNLRMAEKLMETPSCRPGICLICYRRDKNGMLCFSLSEGLGWLSFDTWRPENGDCRRDWWEIENTTRVFIDGKIRLCGNKNVAFNIL